MEFFHKVTRFPFMNTRKVWYGLSAVLIIGSLALVAVRGLNLRVDAGEVVAIVGESGSSKSTAAMAVVSLLPEYADVHGSARLQGNELIGLPDGAMSRFRGNKIGMVFQDPMSALTPVYTVGDQIEEAILVHSDGANTSRQAARARAIEPRKSAWALKPCTRSIAITTTAVSSTSG